ncbi:hypothetical protein [Pararhizobium gei]|uniref:hypothetical protein n=1 Tax=Pararhizobium gei TaxID=1395951 RepID=UPI0023DB7591|nr:hypothetical protein [Rhizobium gei]
MNEYLDVLTKILSIAAILLVAAQFMFGVTIFANRTGELTDRFTDNVLPLVVIADAGTAEMNQAIVSNDPAAFELSVENLVETEKLYGKLISGVDAAEALIRCHSSYFCTVDSYRDFEQVIRRFWYTFRIAIIKQRGNLLPKQFGAMIEAEAARILNAEREAGRLPK